MSKNRAVTVILLAGLLIVSIFPGQAALADDKEPIYDASTDIAARRTATAPTIDGVVDAVWDDAMSFYAFATGPNGNFDIYIRVTFDDDYIYLLASWDDIDDPGAIPPMIPGDTVQREAWELTSNSTPGTWDHKDWGEDRISFLFQDPDAPVDEFIKRGCDGVCHNSDTDMFTNNAGEMLDVWVWSAATTNPQGYADDGSLKTNNSVTQDPRTMHVTEADIQWDSGNPGWIVNNDTSAGGSRPTHVWKPGATPTDPRFMYTSDADEVNWGTFDITTVPQGTMVPGHVLDTPSGDRADVQAKGVFNGTGWNVEFKRLRDTGSADDVAFDDTNVPYYFSPAVTDNRTGVDHSKGITAFKIWLAEPEEPDLAIRNANSPTVGKTVNSTIQIGIWVDNIGWVDSGASKVSASWNNTAIVESADVPAIEWGKFQYTSLDISTDGLAPGNNTLIITADSLDDVTEIDELNNEYELVVLLGEEVLADLEITAIVLDPSSPIEDSPVDVTVTVLNNGTANSPVAELLVYLDDPGSPLFRGNRTVILMGETLDYDFTWAKVDLTEGTYTLNASIDPADDIKELEEDDNDLSFEFDVSAPFLPDLVVESVNPLSGSVTQGAATMAQVVVRNDGGSPTDGTFEVALFLDEAFTVGTQGLMATCSTAEVIPVGGTFTAILTWTVPEDTDLGPHFLRAEVDWMHALEELDEGNNNGTFDDFIVLRMNLPDLVVEAIAPTSPSAKIETIINLTVTVRNIGNLSSSSTTLSVVDLDHDSTLASLIVPALDKNATVMVYFEWLVRGIPEGTLHLQFAVDSEDYIREDNEFNNARAIDLTVQPADLPDLRIAENGVVFSPSEPRIGEGVTISVTFENVGTMASGNTTLEVHVGNTRIDTKNILSLGVGVSRVVDIVWSATNIISPNEYDIRVNIDPDAQIKELNVSNNEVWVKLTFVLAPQPVLDYLNVTLSRTEVKDGESIDVTFSIENTGDAPVTISIVVKDGINEVASEQAITVASGGNKTLNFAIKLEGTGEHVITVTVYRGTEVAQDAEGKDLIRELTVNVKKKDEDPGFGGLLAVIALLGALLVTATIRRRK